MKKALVSLITLLVVSFIIAIPFSAAAQDREKFVISAHAGGINAVTGRATLRAHGSSDWQQLTIKEDLETGDVVSTDLDGRVEMLLNPGSYLRIGGNSEIELTDNSLDNLDIRLVRGTAIVEVTGTDNTELLINITTPHARMAIVRRGLYRVNVVPGDATELIVRKGRVMLERGHTKVKGGDKVIFSDNSFSVAKLKKSDKKPDDLEAWSKNRGQTLARANSRLSGRSVVSLMASFRSSWWQSNFGGRTGFWLYDAMDACYTFFPFGYGWGSPYGSSYGNSLYGTIYGSSGPSYGWPPATGSGGGGNGGGTGSGAGSGAGNGGSAGAFSGAPRSNPPSEGPARTAGPAHRIDTP